MSLHESQEMYLETIFVLSQKSPSVRSIDVAEEMGYSKPSVSRAVALLKNKGYLNVAPDGSLILSEIGVTTARRVFERHTVLSEFLSLIGVSNETASVDACRIEHVISDETVAAIKNYINKQK